MSSNMRIERQCQYCGKRFTARTTTTRHCGDECAKRAYKLRIRDEKIDEAVLKSNVTTRSTILLEISKKEFLNIHEASMLVGASRWTFYRLIEKKEIRIGRIGRRIVIPRNEIDRLFK